MKLVKIIYSEDNKMLTDNYKMITKQLVLASSNISETKKLKLVNFIEEAEEKHLDVILSDSNYIGLSESDIKFIKVIYKDLPFDYKKLVQFQEDKQYIITEFVLTVALITLGYKIYKKFLSKAARTCKKFSGMKKTKCINEFKKDGIKAQISVLERGKSSCSKTRNPSACKVKIKEKVKKLKLKLKTM